MRWRRPAQAAASASLLLLAACAIILVGNREEDGVSLSQRSTRGLVQRLLSLSTGGEFAVDGYSHRQLGRQVDKLQVRMGKIQTAIDGWAPKNAALRTGIQSIWGSRNDAHSLTEYADDHLRDVSNRVDGRVKEIMDGGNGRWLKSASDRIRMGAHELMMQQHKRDAAQDSRLDALEQFQKTGVFAGHGISGKVDGIKRGSKELADMADEFYSAGAVHAITGVAHATANKAFQEHAAVLSREYFGNGKKYDIRMAADRASIAKGIGKAWSTFSVFLADVERWLKEPRDRLNDLGVRVPKHIADVDERLKRLRNGLEWFDFNASIIFKNATYWEGINERKGKDVVERELQREEEEAVKGMPCAPNRVVIIRIQRLIDEIETKRNASVAADEEEGRKFQEIQESYYVAAGKYLEAKKNNDRDVDLVELKRRLSEVEAEVENKAFGYVHEGEGDLVQRKKEHDSERELIMELLGMFRNGGFDKGHTTEVEEILEAMLGELDNNMNLIQGSQDLRKEELEKHRKERADIEEEVRRLDKEAEKQGHIMEVEDPLQKKFRIILREIEATYNVHHKAFLEKDAQWRKQLMGLYEGRNKAEAGLRICMKKYNDEHRGGGGRGRGEDEEEEGGGGGGAEDGSRKVVSPSKGSDWGLSNLLKDV